MNKAGRKAGGTRGPSRRPAAQTKPLLMTLQEASAEYGPPYTSLRDLVMRGHLPAVRLPGSSERDCRRIWIRRDDLERLIARSVERVS
jgi:hypothetical protein